jgi:deoxyribodipyrimidine photo-lyase
MIEPDALATGQGKPYQVFTPYWKKFTATPRVPQPLDAPSRLNAAADPGGPPLEALELLPTIAWDRGLQEMWNPGAEAAKVLLQRFLKGPLERYDGERDLPAIDGTSRLSPYLHWGEISPRRLWHVCHGRPGAEPWLRQLVWREFAHQMLHHFPHTPEQPLREEFAAFPWDGDPALLPAWQKGRTGYPLVDAGMRQLWHTGWMHNRVRMVVASFLVKHLLLPWQEGARWFWDTLVDASLANNTFGWQWTAGCGADAAPYFRIFNPISQGQKFQASDYIRQWVPELKRVPDKLLHEPWTGSRAGLEQVGVKLGKDYPRPIVDHKQARQRALDSYQQMKSGS